jgi:lipopolysaccharide assembly protein A
MRAIRFGFWALVALCLVVMGLANRDIVVLRALPEGLAGLVGLSPDISLPLFVVIFIGVAIGLLIGFVWEWLREGRLRAAARGTAREVDALQREVGRLRNAQSAGQDDVLALLDQPARR